MGWAFGKSGQGRPAREGTVEQKEGVDRDLGTCARGSITDPDRELREARPAEIRGAHREGLGVSGNVRVMLRVKVTFGVHPESKKRARGRGGQA